MLDFSAFINLPVFFAFVFALAVFMYVSLDGFDLGVGILKLFADESHQKDMLATVAPFWDGNETWLILSGGVLFIAFPLAYSILMPAFYMPILLMLMSLVFRGVAFEFHYKSQGNAKKRWGLLFSIGSLCAAFFQGVLLGTYLQGIDWSGRVYTGGPLGWVSAFSLFTGAALCVGYALLGSTWLILKSDGSLQSWSQKMALGLVLAVLVLLLATLAWAPFLHPAIYARWLTPPHLYVFSVIPGLTMAVTLWLLVSILCNQERAPFWLTHALFALCYLGLLISVFPHIVPHSLDFHQAAASAHSLSFMLIGVVFILPIILGYTAYTYYVFRGKIHHEYH